MTERVPLLVSTFFYFFSGCSTLLAFKGGSFRPGRFVFSAMLLGVFFQSWFLLLRGAAEHACPLATLPEILIFLSWSIALFYLLIGSTYRLSLMGAFTAPLILFLQTAAFCLSENRLHSPLPSNPWVEAHAALSLVAFGAFGLACVSGLMFLLQEKQLKSQHPSPIFHHLPPIRILEEVTMRLLWMGFILLTISFAAGFVAHFSISGTKFWVSLLVWGSYLSILIAHQKEQLSGNRLARLAILVFVLALLILPSLRYLSQLSLR